MFAPSPIKGAKKIAQNSAGSWHKLRLIFAQQLLCTARLTLPSLCFSSCGAGKSLKYATGVGKEKKKKNLTAPSASQR